MKHNICNKLLFILISVIYLINITPFAATAEFYKPEVRLIKIVTGTPTKTIYVQTVVTTDTKPLPDFKEYICIFGLDNRLKSVAIIEPKTDVTETLMRGNFDMNEDYIRLFLWNDDMKPYSDGEPIPLKDIKKTIIHADGAMSGGYGSGSINGSIGQ